MALQKSVAVRDAENDAGVAAIGASAHRRISTGSQPAACATADSGTLLVDRTLPSTWMGASSGGVMSKAGTWSGVATGGAGSPPGHFRFKDSTNTNVGLQGSAGIGSGDMSADGTITSGQTVTISICAITAGGA